MRFRDDTRGVTVQIGAVLLFATIIIVLATYQATVVPAQNADVEYQHSQEVQNQLTDVRNNLLQTAASGNTRPASVTLGTQYPSRVFLLNPPPAAGTLTTGTYDGNGTISVSNVNATDDETADFFAANNNAWSASTKYLAYQPDYHEYDNAPDLVFGATMLSNHYPDSDASVPLTDQLLFDNSTNTITLVALNGSLSTSRSDSVAVSAAPVSAPYTAVQVEPENDGKPVNVTVPTHVDNGTLANATDLGSHESVSVDDAGDGRVTIQLSGDGPFTLKTAKLGVGSDVASEGAQYLRLVEDDSDSVTVEARDRFNNPVGGVNVSVNGSNPFGEPSRSTGEDGRATFEAADGRSGPATLEILGGDNASERVTTDFGAGFSGDTDAAYVVEWMEQEIESQNSALTCSGGICTVDGNGNAWMLVELYADSSPVVDGGTFAFEVNDTSVGTVSPEQETTDSSGVASTTLNATSNGSTYVYASSGGSGDRVRIDVENISSGGGGGNGDAQNVEITQTQINNGQIRIQFRNNNPTSVAFERARLDAYSEANSPSNPNQEPIDRVVYQPEVDGSELVSGDALERVDGPTISNGGNEGITLQPQRLDSTGGGTTVDDADAQSGDTVTFTVEFEDGSTRQYTVSL